MITVPASPDPSYACLRVYPGELGYDYIETKLDSYRLAILISQLAIEHARILQYEANQRKCRL
jgi:hypothetical protein